MSTSASTHAMLRTIHLTDVQIDELLDHLDAEQTAYGTVSSDAKAFPYRIKRLCAAMEQPGGVAAQFQVVARSLSEHSVSFLHGGYVHVGSSCDVQLISLYGAWDDLPGAVTSCRYIRDGIHEVVVRFARQINVPLYNRAAIRTRVLLAEDEPISAMLAQYYLAELNATVDHVEDGLQAVEKAFQESYDLILLGIEMPIMDGFEATRELRSKGYMGMIIAVIAHTEEETRAKCLQCGCDRVIFKPYTPQDLSDAITTLVEEPLYSTLADRERMSSIICAFVSSLPAALRTIEEALAQDDAQKITSVARLLKGQGSPCGFEPITTAAVMIETDLIGGKSVDAVRNDIVALTKLCRSARPPQ